MSTSHVVHISRETTGMMTIGNLMCEISMLRSLLITRVQSARRAAVHHGDGAPWFRSSPWHFARAGEEDDYQSCAMSICFL